MKLPCTLLGAFALASGCACWASNDKAQNGEEKALFPRGAMTVEIPFYTKFYFNLQMLVNVTIGTPGQLKPMAIVTLWGDSQLTNGTNIVDDSSFVPANSSTYTPIPNSGFNATEQPGFWYSGEYAQDTLSMNGETFAGVTFAMIEDGNIFSEDFLGLGDKVDEAAVTTDSSATEQTFLTYAVSKNLIQSPAYSISFDDPSQKLPTGKIILGGIDTGRITGGLETLATTIVRGTNTFYNTVLTITLQSISFSSSTHQQTLSSFQSIQVHPTAGSMSLPPSLATSIWNALGATYDHTITPETAVPIVPCSYLSNTTTISLQFSQKTTIAIPISELTVRNGTGLNNEDGLYAEACKLDIVAIATNESFNSVGAQGLKYMYTVFDLLNNEISIGGRSKDVSPAPTLVAIGQRGVRDLNLGGSGVGGGTGNGTGSNPPATGSKKKDSHGLAIGLGVGLSLGIIVLIANVVGCIYFLRRQRRNSQTPAFTPVSQNAPAEAKFIPTTTPGFPPPQSQQGYTNYPEVLAEKPPSPINTSPQNTHQGDQGSQPTSTELPHETSQNTPHGVHELTGASVQYSELSGISSFQPQHEHGHLYSPASGPPIEK